MSLMKKGRIAGVVIVSVILLTVCVAGFAVNTIRFGGSLSKKNDSIAELLTDIAPPSQFLVEPYLEATLLVENPSTFAIRKERLGKLEEAYQAGLGVWRNADLDPLIKTRMEQQAEGSARFWEEVDKRLLPAAARGDREEMQRSHDRLGPIYASHREQVVAMLDQAGQKQTEIRAGSASELAWISTALAVMAIAIVALIVAAQRFVQQKMLAPIAETAETMTRMAAGDLDAGRRLDHEDNEIGAMTRAIEVFRATAEAQVTNAVKLGDVVETMSAALQEIAAGNLADRIVKPMPTEYETLRETYNSAVEQLASLVGHVATSAQSVNLGAKEIRAATEDLAVRNERQAASLEEAAAAMSQVTGSIAGTARDADDLQRKVLEAHRQATKGGAVVESATAAMAAIETSSSEITKIVDMIDGIAFQTNLLALNAGVEAARAGEAGRGFAVVANEVRALAARSAEAAREIKGLISSSTQEVSEGVAHVGNVGRTLQEIVTNVGQISELVVGIAGSAKDQSVNVQQINSSVGEMDRMTQQNAAMVEQSNAASRNLADEAAQLSSMVAQFRIPGRSSIKALAPVAQQPAQVELPAPATMVRGNLALKPVAAEGVDVEDWSEF